MAHFGSSVSRFDQRSFWEGVGMACRGTPIPPSREAPPLETTGLRCFSSKGPYPCFHGTRFSQGALPDREDVPSGGPKLPGHPPVAFLVVLKHTQPETSPGCRSAATTLAVVPMPETAVNEDSHARAREDEVRGAGKILHVLLRTISEIEQHCKNEFLGARSTRLDAPHDGRSSLRR